MNLYEGVDVLAVLQHAILIFLSKSQISQLGGAKGCLKGTVLSPKLVTGDAG